MKSHASCKSQSMRNKFCSILPCCSSRRAVSFSPFKLIWARSLARDTCRSYLDVSITSRLKTLICFDFVANMHSSFLRLRRRHKRISLLGFDFATLSVYGFFWLFSMSLSPASTFLSLVKGLKSARSSCQDTRGNRK